MSGSRVTQRNPDVLANAFADGTEAAVIGAYAHAATGLHEVTLEDDAEEETELRLYGLDADGAHRLVDTIDLEKIRDRPGVRRGQVKVATPDALITYAKRHLDPHRSTLWANIDTGLTTVVLNDHADSEFDHEPGWADHRVEMQMLRSPEWKAWTEINNKQQSQVELALFLEEHMLEIVEPDGSTLVEVTETFHATQGATFKSSQQLQSGEQRLVYEEDVQASAGRTTQREIPTDLTLALRPWIGVERVAVKAKFRFRIRDGHLVLFVSLLNLEEVSRTAVENAVAEVADELQLHPIEGVAPAARR